MKAPKYSSYAQVNADFFDTAGSPVGASTVPPGSLPDPDQVAGCPAGGSGGE
jgi:hypothetical protein